MFNICNIIMKLIKLNTTDSTNTYLMQLSKQTVVDNWTVVTAEFQTLGKGQMHNKWESEYGKNLITSALVLFEGLDVENQFYLNCAVSLGVLNALQDYNLPKLTVKWPNDIMAGNKKLGGILIENSLKKKKIFQAVLGIGLNINQKTFSGHLLKAISMQQILKKEVDREVVLRKIITSVKEEIKKVKSNNFALLHKNYEEALFKKDKVLMFENADKKQFLAKVIGITIQGKLKLLDENKMVSEYNLKEIKFL